MEQGEDLVVVLTGGSLAEPCAADGVGLDAGVNYEARGSDIAAASKSLAAASANSSALAA